MSQQPPDFQPPPAPPPPGGVPPPPPPPPAVPPPAGAPPPPPGGCQPAPVAYAPALPTNQTALLSMILGIVGFVSCGLAAPFAIWLARRAKREIAASNGTQGGDGMATAGLVLGIIGLIFLVLFALYIIFIIVIAILGIAFSTVPSTP